MLLFGGGLIVGVQFMSFFVLILAVAMGAVAFTLAQESLETNDTVQMII